MQVTEEMREDLEEACHLTAQTCLSGIKQTSMYGRCQLPCSRFFEHDTTLMNAEQRANP
jgi:predicted molibdopterin-dependent oxidoreductase YjgC